MNGKLTAFLLIIIMTSVNAQRFNLQTKNKCLMAACYDPNKGFIIKENPIMTDTNNDYFIVDFTKGLFTWKNSNGTNSYKMLNRSHTEDKHLYTFNTENYSVRYTINDNGINFFEIEMMMNDKWYNFSYTCTLE